MSSRFPAGIVRPVILLVLIGFILCTAGCIHSVTDNGSSSTDPGSANAAGNDTNISVSSVEFTRTLQGFVAGPVRPADNSIIRSTMIPVIRTTSTSPYLGPTLHAKGVNEVNISEVTLQSETIDPSGIK
ncbi:MAG TPA: hypothetical protein P5013_07375 [Methanoregula sp.]|nr:hypothetical protein [Methanoregula sp.]